MLTCSHTLSSRSICRNLYLESSFVFCFLVVCQIRSFLVFSFPLLSLSQMYWAFMPPLLPSACFIPSIYLFHSAHVLPSACIDANLIARIHEQGNVHNRPCFQCGGFRDVVCGVAAYPGLSAHHFQVYEGWRLDGDDGITIDESFYGIP